MTENDKKIIQQDKILLKLMMHTYDDENKRNELIDSKNSQMIVFLGIMLIQVTLFANILSNYLSGNEWPCIIKMFSFIFLIFNILIYVVAINKFIDAYAFCGDFIQAPDPKILLKDSNGNIGERKLLKKGLTNFPDVISHNSVIMENKVKKAKDGFKFLKYGGFVNILFITCIFTFMICF